MHRLFCGLREEGCKVLPRGLLRSDDPAHPRAPVVGVSDPAGLPGEKKDYVEDIRKLLDVPEEYTLVSLVPAGYPEEIDIKKKKGLDEVTFSERYEEEE